MSEVTALNLDELRSRLQSGALTSTAVVTAFHEAYLADAKGPQPLNGYVEWFKDAIALAEAADSARRRGEAVHGLLGLPIAVKDNILVKGRALTCASEILKGFTAPYSATVIERLVNAGMIPVGRTNMDEFAMGSSCEYSCYGPAHNPVDRSRTAGGSSGGSAAVVAGNQAPVALGSETGGSVRLPASFCGVYGLKPSYGSLSRYGLVAFGSSLDQIGIVGRCPRDLALILSVAAGKDPNDETSADTDFSRLGGALVRRDLKGLRIAIPEEFLAEGLDSEVRRLLDSFVAWARTEGALVETISLPILEASVAIYYIIAPAEASSNLARYDGVRYGFREKEIANLFELYERTRSRGFGKEVKRRILLGNYVLSSGYYDAYYKKAQGVRTLLIKEVGEVLSRYDLILSPTAPTPAFALGSKVDDPLAMYLSDIYTTFANLALLPSLSLPAGRTQGGLPVGVQITGGRFAEELLLSCAERWHEEGGVR